MSKLTAAARSRIKSSNFALPQQRKYPIHDIEHARLALAMVAAHGTSYEIRTVRAAVYKKYPSLRK